MLLSLFFSYVHWRKKKSPIPHFFAPGNLFLNDHLVFRLVRVLTVYSRNIVLSSNFGSQVQYVHGDPCKPLYTYKGMRSMQSEKPDEETLSPHIKHMLIFGLWHFKMLWYHKNIYVIIHSNIKGKPLEDFIFYLLFSSFERTTSLSK